MSFQIVPFNPIVAFGIVFEHTVIVEGVEGTTIIQFTNTSNVINVGDPVFTRSADGTILQYRGIARVSNEFGLFVDVPLQDDMGVDASVWVPTNFVVFTGEVRGSQAQNDDDGAATIPTNGGLWFGYRFKDPIKSVSLSFSVRNSTAYEDWRTFRNTDRRSMTQSFNLGYFDMAVRRGMVAKVKGFSGDHSVSTVNWLTTGFSQQFGIEAEPPTTGVYVES